jgi:hypothetical protein
MSDAQIDDQTSDFEMCNDVRCVRGDWHELAFVGCACNSSSS